MPPTDEVLVHARALTKRFGALHRGERASTSTCAPREAFGFLGPNGAGKTSTMRMIACASPVTEGDLTVIGMDPRTQAAQIKARLGVVPQIDNLDAELTVLENLLMYARYFDMPMSVARPRAARAARVHAALRAGQRPGRAALRRDEAAPDDRPRAHQRPGAAHPRRADDRPRPAGAPPPVGAPLPPQAARRHPDHHHPLHGRGRAALRSAGGDGQGRDRGRRDAARADRAVRHEGGARAAHPRGRRAPGSTAASTASPSGSRSCRIGTSSTRPTASRRSRGCTPARSRSSRALVRRATLEDVFLRLTGRSLVE